MPHEPDIKVDSPSQGSESSSSTLLHLVQAQDPLAWQRLVDLYAPLIYRWCRRRNLQADEAADVAQEVFAAVFAKVVFAGEAWITCLSWSPSGKELVASELGGMVNIWDVASGTLLSKIQAGSPDLRCVAWSSDGTTIAYEGYDGTITLWDVATRQAVRRLPAGGAFAVSWHPHAAILASGGVDTKVKLWDVKTGDTVKVFEGHTRPVDALVWSSDGRMLASGTSDNQPSEVRLWLADSGELIHSLPSVWPAMANGIAWSPDGKNLFCFAPVTRGFRISSSVIAASPLPRSTRSRRLLTLPTAIPSPAAAKRASCGLAMRKLES